MLARPDHDDRARQDFIGALKRRLSQQVRPANRDFFSREAAPAYEAAHGHAPTTDAEIADAMLQNPHWQLWSTLNHAAQRQMWTAMSTMLDRCEADQTAKYQELTASESTLGSLELDPDFPIPAPIRDTEIHCQPGGYCLERTENDFRAGALYESGGMLYSRGQGVGDRESKAEVVLRFLADRYPGFSPHRVLDLACAAGASSTPYAEAFPDAEIHAVDVAPGLLRYAHARAEALGVAVHFHQRSATATGFPDESFDLVVSHNAMHEMSQETARAMFRESYRLLKPGGVCVHQDVPLRYAELDEYSRFERSWERYYNGEIFWIDYCTLDLQQALADAGFPAGECYLGFINQSDASFRWYAACARKPVAPEAASGDNR
jgi:2-polyprenyl-3-methyl-5-hydroxy-6-metoxy-1,4-benzoquinol methylase